jgi:hypothetical protein
MLSVAGLLLMCAAGAGLSALSNLTLPPGPTVLDQLTPLDKARLQETLHLKDALGEAVWPGWGQADIPLLIWNQDYVFLTGYADPPPDWQPVPDDDFASQPYYRQVANDPQNFVLLIGERWVASLATKWEMDHFLMTQFRNMMPGPLKPVFPYRVLIQPSEVHITGVLHESFHAYVAVMAPTRFAETDEIYRTDESYWTMDATMREAWEAEIRSLTQAVQAETDDQAATWVRQFLSQRAERRQTYELEPALVTYEREFEWLEGLAKYVELQIWREAANRPDYEPIADMSADADFKAYATFAQRWSQELGQLQRQAGQEGEVRFYYTGLAQATVLDRLMPGWKMRILSEAVGLEDLLREAVQPDQ